MFLKIEEETGSQEVVTSVDDIYTNYCQKPPSHYKRLASTHSAQTLDKDLLTSLQKPHLRLSKMKMSLNGNT